MSRRNPIYHLLNIAIDTVGRSLVKEMVKRGTERYLPTARQSPAVKNDASKYSPDIKDDVTNLIKVEKPDVYFDRNIGGLRDAKEELKKHVIYPIIRRDLYSLYEKPLGNVLLYGPPGCGKTSLVKAVANECGWPFVYPKISDIIKRNIGDREKTVPTIFGYCRSLYVNSILFIDESEQLFLRNGPPYVQRIKNEFEKEIDGIDTKKGFPVVIAASKKPWLIEPSMRRPGRFKLIFVPPPNLYERKEILRIGLNKLLYKGMIEGDFEMLVSDLAERTPNFSGDDLVNSLIESAIDIPFSEAMRGETVRKIRRSDFEEVLKMKKPSTNTWFVDAVKACKRYEEKDLLEEILKFSPQ